MVEKVDDDGSGQIEFPEFLMIIKGRGDDPQCAAISQFFKGLSSEDGEFSKKAITFTTYVQQKTRDFLLDAINPYRHEKNLDLNNKNLSEEQKAYFNERKKKGEKIMANIKLYLQKSKAEGSK